MIFMCNMYIYISYIHILHSWWDPDCDLLDIYCWKKIDPKTLGHDDH